MARGRFPSVGAKEGGATWKSGDRHRWLFEAGGKGGGKGGVMVEAGRPQAPGANLEKGPMSPAPGEPCLRARPQEGPEIQGFHARGKC